MTDYQQKKGKRNAHYNQNCSTEITRSHSVCAENWRFLGFFLFDNHIQIHVELLAPFIEISKDGCIK